MRFYKSNIEVITKYIIIFIGLIYQASILDNVRYFLMAVATAQVLYIILQNKKLYRKFIYFVSGAFLISFLITIIFSQYSKYNLIELIDMFLLMFGLGNVINLEENKKMYKYLSYGYIFFTFLMSVVDLGLYLTYYSGKYYFIDHYEYIGMHDGRLWGIFNANMTATLCLVSIILSYIGIVSKNRYKKFLIVNIFLNFNVFIFAQSRSAWLGMSVVIVVAIFKSRLFKNKFLKIVFSLILCATLYLGSFVYNQAIIELPKMVVELEDIETNGEDIEAIRYIEDSNKLQGRGYLWEKGSEIFKENPLFGKGLYPMKEGVNEYFEKIWTPVVRQAGIHNLYIMVLSVGGIMGIGIFLVYITYLVYNAVKNILIKEMNQSEAVLWAMLIAVFVQELAESRIFYWLNYFSLISFLIIGYLIRKMEDENEKVCQ